MMRSPKTRYVREQVRAWGLLVMALALIAGLGGFLSHHSYFREDTRQREQLLTQASMLSQAVNIRRIKTLKGDSGDLESLDYQRLKEQLGLARSANTQCRFLYLLGKRGDEVFFLVDSEPAGSKDYSPPGQIFTEVPDATRGAFETMKGIVVGPVRDRWGTWMSAAVPIIDTESGKVAALFGMDCDAHDWRLRLAGHTLPSVLISGLLATIVIAFFVQSRGSLEALRRIAASYEAVRESEAKVSSVLRAAPVGIAVAEKDMFADVNDALCDITGYAREEVLGLPVCSIYASEEDRIRAEEEVARQTAEKGTGTVETLWRRKDGAIIDIILSSTPLDRNKPEGGHTFTAMDVTERKRVQVALQRQVASLANPMDDAGPVRFAELFAVEDIQRIQDVFSDATGVASIITDPDGTPITRPSNFCRLCIDVIRKTEKGLANCFRSDAVIGRRNSEGPIVQPCLSGGLWDAGASITVGGRHVANWLIGQVRNEAQNDEWMLRYAEEIGADREEFRRALAEVPIMSQEKFTKVADALFLFANELSLKAYQNLQQARFIAERKRTEKEREKLEAQLRQAQKMEAVGQLAGGIAHDFNNLLQVILGQLEITLGHDGLDARTRERLASASEAAGRAAELTRQLLAFGRRQIIQPVNIDLNALIQGLLSMVRRCIGEHIELHFLPDKQIRTVHVDRSQIEQVVMNLCVNARDAMPSGGTLTIRTENATLDAGFCEEHPWAMEGQYVLLIVSDTGHGMDEETRAQMFEPFFTTKDLGHGTGLGLATVYGIVKQHNGLIQVSSAPREGTSLKIYIPCAERTVNGAIPHETPSAAVGGQETILVAEDEDIVRKLVTHILESAGYTVLAASDGEEAVRLFNEHDGRIDLALFDVIMPRLGGRDAMERIRAQHPGARFLFSSGYSEHAIDTNFVIQEGLRLISKPYSKTDLLRAIRKELDARAVS
ncbi:MAG: PocR ligand-binding domain-containing protein [Candidatus Hydrogenedentes bacterium]|nr:PocR ligand-binding domain-containing protein [Candidatus Hydrogenedentota bacterium]